MSVCVLRRLKYRCPVLGLGAQWQRRGRSTWMTRRGRSSAVLQGLPELATFQVPRQGHGRVVPASQALEKAAGRDVSVAIIGASGVMGRQIATSLAANIQRNCSVSNSTLKLVGRRKGHSPGVLVGLCSELRDAYGEACPNLEVVVDLEAVEADIIIMCAGASLSLGYNNEAEVTRANLSIFDEVAAGLAKRNSSSVVLTVSNPVELGVETLVEAGFDRNRVLGTGAFLQSLRFRREVAMELGVLRQHISGGYALGKHGLHFVPIWSSVQLAAHKSTPELEEKLQRLKEEGLARLPFDTDELRRLAIRLKEMTQEGDVLGASALVNEQPPDYRTSLRRYTTFFSGPPVARIGNAEAVTRLVYDLLSGKSSIISAQKAVRDDEFLGINGTIGAPVTISGCGGTVAPMKFHPAEENAILQGFKCVQAQRDATRMIKMMRNSSRGVAHH